jgi:hypothetical protein
MKTIDILNKFANPSEAVEHLKTTYGINSKVEEYSAGKLYLLDYDQINSPKTDPIVIECRSLILGWTDYEGFFPISRKFDRFFNYGEAIEYYTDFNINNAVVMEKADGSICGVYYNPFTDRWDISTRGMPFASGEHVLGGTFRDKILDAFGVTEENFQQIMEWGFSREWTFIFEYCSPENRIVTKYESPIMVFLGATRTDGVQCDPQYQYGYLVSTFNMKMNVRSAKKYDFEKDFLNLCNEANSLPNMEEGFVLYDHQSGKRVKIKSSAYLVAHRLRGNDPVPTRKNMLELVLSGETSEFLIYFPEWTELVDGLQKEVDDFMVSMDYTYSAYRHLESQKDFALSIKGLYGSGFLFNARKLGITPKEAFDRAELTTKIKIFLTPVPKV